MTTMKTDFRQNGFEVQTSPPVSVQVAESEMAILRDEALTVLEKTSRTFFIPISRLPPGLLEAVGSAYLCFRAIDEIEDHAALDHGTKVKLLRNISQTLQSSVDGVNRGGLWVTSSEYRDKLPEVTIRLGDWVQLAPKSVAPRIWDATATMADRMADWVMCNWRIQTEADLDRYTFGVAGAVGLLLSDLWAWYNGTMTYRVHAIGFGRGLQSVNILRNHSEDLARGVEFFPDGWNESALHVYARRNLGYADAYVSELPQGPVMEFCRIPLTLAYATLDALAQGRRKLERSEIVRLVGGCER